MRAGWAATGRLMAGLLFAAGAGFVSLVAAGVIFAHSPAAAQDPPVVKGTVTDSISGAPLEGIEVELVASSAAIATQTATTSAEGEYQLDDVVPGEYTLFFTDPRTECEEDPHLQGQESVEVGPTGNEVTVDTELDPGAHIRGTVRAAATSDRAEDVLVFAAPVFPFVSAGFAITDANGGYEMCGMSPALYDVLFLPDGDTDLNVEIVRDFRLQLGEKRELNMLLLGLGDSPPKLIPVQLSRTEAEIGDEITATTGGEFKAHSQTFAFVFSEPVPVALPLADAAGAVQLTFTVTDAIGVGDHQLRIFGVDHADNAVVGLASFTVLQATQPTPEPTPAPPPPTPTPTPTPTATATATPDSKLPDTGSDVFPMVVIATWSIFVGMLMREHARRRRPPGPGVLGRPSR